MQKGEDLQFRYWAPHAEEVQVKIWDGIDPNSGVLKPLEKKPDGYWSVDLEDGWAPYEGSVYAYEVTDSRGNTQLRADPYARQRQGTQRGVDDLFLDLESGREVHKFANNKQAFTRFEVQEIPGATRATLVLRDESGQTLDRAGLLERLGSNGGELVRLQHRDFWLDHTDEQGRVELLAQGQAWAAILPQATSLEGLSYTFELFDAQGNLLGDEDGNRVLDPAETRRTPYNDAYSSKLTGEHRWQRFGIIENDSFEWQNDGVPRLAADPDRQVIYQLHVGSIFGDANNVDRASFKDLIDRLDYFKDLGVNTLELLPVNSFEGTRDWGYIGSHSFAISEQYGFVDEDGEWVEGDEALKRFVDAAHGKGFKVFNDVVYNHFGGDFNPVWNVGGPEEPLVRVE